MADDAKARALEAATRALCRDTPRVFYPSLAKVAAEVAVDAVWPIATAAERERCVGALSRRATRLGSEGQGTWRDAFRRAARLLREGPS